jgi:plastocyanin
MHKALLSATVLLALALAGCSGGDDEPTYQAVTCPDGTVLTPEQVKAAMETHESSGETTGHDHGGHGADATSLCPVAPSVSLTGLPAALQAFKTAPFSWTLDNGSVPHAHSMLTSIRYSASSVADRDLTNLAKYPNELIKREHQDIPISYNGNLSFAKAGKVYLRAYAQIAGADYWSPEVELTVTPVPVTGTIVDVVQGMGDSLSPPAPAEVGIILGDAVRLVNEDLRDHTCTFGSGPAVTNDLSAAALTGASEPVVFLVPGQYSYTCDTLQASTLTVRVALNP